MRKDAVLLFWMLALGLLLMGCLAAPPSVASPWPTTPAANRPLPSPSATTASQPGEPPTAPPTSPPPSFWQRTNPGGGGAFNAAAIGPDNAWLVASDLSGAYLSRDAGATWHPLGAAQGLTVTHVASVAFDPRDPALLYAGTEDGIFRSADGSQTFTVVLAHGYIEDIRFAPSQPNIGYAAYHSAFDVADGRVYATQDRGLTWHALPNQGLPAGLHLLKLRIHPQHPEVLFALAGEGRFACGPAALFLSRNGGTSWQRLAPELGQILDFALDPHDPNRLYLSTYGDVWDPGYACVTDDPAGGWVYTGAAPDTGEPTWQPISVPLGARNLLLWPDPTRPATLRVLDLDYREVWATEDRGATWSQLSDFTDWDPGWSGSIDAYGSSFNGDAKTWTPHPQRPDTLLWVDSQSVWVTHDGGKTFHPAHTTAQPGGGWQSTGLDNIVPFDLALDANGRDIYAGLADLGCWHSPDYGKTWQICNDPRFTGTWEGRGGNTLTVLADPDRPGVVWLSQAPELDTGPHVLLRSEDFAASWRAVGEGLPNAPLAGLSLAPSSPPGARTLWITAGGDVYRSLDDGTTWQLALACGGCRITAVDPFPPQRVFAGGEAGLWRSEQGGAPGTWNRIGPPEFVGENPEGVFWDSAWQGVAALRFEPGWPEGVWAAVFGEERGIYYSADGGSTWQQVLAHDFARDVLPLNHGEIWAATSSALYSGGYVAVPLQGVLRSPDHGRTWHPYNQGLAWPLAIRLLYDPARQRMWAALPGLGYGWRAWPP